MRLTKYKNTGEVKSNPGQPCPVGMIVGFANATPPGDWLKCDGSVVSQETYSLLYALITTTYNTGSEGAGNFRLPNMNGRTPIGVGSGSGLTARSLGATSGGASLTLSGAQSGKRDHSHSVSQTNHGHSGSDTHTHGIGYNLFGTTSDPDATVALPDGGNPLTYNMVSQTPAWTVTGGVMSGITITNSTAVAAASPHPNLQPSLVVSYIIKVK